MRHLKKVTRPLFLWILITLCIVPCVVAQETTAGLQGVVKDPSGGVIVGATVEVSSPALIGSRKVETDPSGQYRIVALPRANTQ